MGEIPVIQCRNLSRKFGSKTVLNNVSFEVYPGIIGLLGPNGAGKTTSFYMIVGLVAADAGRIEIDDTIISSMPSDPQQGDILPVGLISLVLSFVATIYPSWRASRVNPAEALRYE